MPDRIASRPLRARLTTCRARPGRRRCGAPRPAHLVAGGLSRRRSGVGCEPDRFLDGRADGAECQRLQVGVRLRLRQLQADGRPGRRERPGDRQAEAAGRLGPERLRARRRVDRLLGKRAEPARGRDDLERGRRHVHRCRRSLRACGRRGRHELHGERDAVPGGHDRPAAARHRTDHLCELPGAERPRRRLGRAVDRRRPEDRQHDVPGGPAGAAGHVGRQCLAGATRPGRTSASRRPPLRRSTRSASWISARAAGSARSSPAPRASPRRPTTTVRTGCRARAGRSTAASTTRRSAAARTRPRCTGGVVFPDAVYYCSQDLVAALCARSDTGGTTFNPAVPIYTDQCGGLHGHVQVSADGTVYVPNKNCGGAQGVVVVDRQRADLDRAHRSRLDERRLGPVCRHRRDNTVYFGYGDGDGHPKVAVSHDHGTTWSTIRDVGVPFGISTPRSRRSSPATTTAPAFAFLGTSEPSAGAFADDPSWPGVVAPLRRDDLPTAATRGRRSTPRRTIPCSAGRSAAAARRGCNNGTRNLLDFMGITVDKAAACWSATPTAASTPAPSAGPNSFTALRRSRAR